MNKEELRKHCEGQIEKCIKLHDSKHLKEHELSLALLNECEQRKQNQENLIKYLENKIEERGFANDVYRYTAYKDILERIKSGKYE